MEDQIKAAELEKIKSDTRKSTIEGDKLLLEKNELEKNYEPHFFKAKHLHKRLLLHWRQFH
jgi:hypothetical protein